MNKVILIGNLTRDPELRSTPAGASVCSFSIAVNRRFSNSAGEKETDFINIVAWRQLGETCGKYLNKGSKVGVVGELRTRTYEAKDGTKRYVTEVQADEIDFLTPKGGNTGGTSYSAPVEAASQDVSDSFTEIDDDELPF